MPRCLPPRVRRRVAVAPSRFFLGFSLGLFLLAPTARAQNPPDAGAAPAGTTPAPDAEAQRPTDTNPYRFGKDPTRLDRWSNIELWDAVDYLVRIGEADQAVPFLNAFLARRPDDATLLAIRDRYGLTSILRLQDSKATRARALPLLNLVTAASRREVSKPERLQALVGSLAASPEEQDYAIERLREARALAVPPLLKALADPNLSAEARARIVASMGRLDHSAVPPLIAALESPDAKVAAGAAEALGHLRDDRAIPFLAYPAVGPDVAPAVREAASRAYVRLAGRSAHVEPRALSRMLTDEARRYMEHRVEFPEGPFEIWTWQGDAPAPQRMTRERAEAAFGRRFASQAVALDPGNHEAKAILLALTLRGAEDVSKLPASDPDILARVLRAAIVRGDSSLGSAAIAAIAKQTKPEDLIAQGEQHPLVQGLAAPDRLIRFAAARALVELNPRRPFLGSSRVVPTLLPFAEAGEVPRVIIVDGNAGRANGIGSVFQSLGYAFQTAPSAERGFELAADSADVEAVIIRPDALQGAWSAADLLTNLRADTRTAAVPAFLILPEDLARIHARAEQLSVLHEEVEDNSVPNLATPLSFSDRPRQARIGGRISPTEDLGDLFAMGRLRAGDSVSATISVPEFSTLKPDDVTLTLERRDENTGRSTALVHANRVLVYTMPTDGVYYLRVQAPKRQRGNYARYLLDVALADLSPPGLNTALRQKLDDLAARYARTAVLTAPESPPLLARQFNGELRRFGIVPLTAEQHANLHRGAIDLLTKLAVQPEGPFADDIAAASPALATILSPTAPVALQSVPSPDAQRALASVLLDSGRPVAERAATADALARSIRKFGPLLTSDQERRLSDALAAEPDATLQTALARVLEALRPIKTPPAPGGAGAAQPEGAPK